ncbi:MAG: L,D-transpeptidase [Leptolyngbyaceae bacterium]|nr:L,D-transpeptidase [Leptolyngbyaceae bacterium]
MKTFFARYESQVVGVAAIALAASIQSVMVGGEAIANPQPQPIPMAQAMTVPQALETLRQSERRWIEINLSSQRLMAWQGNERVYAVIISSGTQTNPTLPGVFAIQSKHEEARMQGEDYDVPDVPFAMYYDGNYAIHGAYWHNQFGTPMSHGCINVAVDHAEWLFNWAATGTPVVVHY